MRKILFGAFTFVLSFGALAHESTAKDVNRLRALVDVGTNGGDTYLFKYDVKKFNYSRAIATVLEDTKESECSYVVVKSRREMKQEIGSFASFAESDEAQNIVKRLISSGHVKAAIGYYWDGVKGYSEYCLREGMTLYFYDGQALSVEYDSTT